MTGRAIIVLALAATGLLVVGAWLLESPTPVTMVLALLSLTAGMALAAAAVAGAWRVPSPAEPEPAPRAPGAGTDAGRRTLRDHSPRLGSAAGPT